MRILLTNDDGIEAPGLIPFARALSPFGDVRVVVPDRERSWVGKAITRFDPVRVDHRTVGGVEVVACTGYPADCVQLGVNSLFDDRPDVVVSGVNIGYNHGSAYLQSSGTAGAALEAAIAGVPAIAFSAGSITIPWGDWRKWVVSDEARPMWEGVAAVAARLTNEAAPLMQPGDVLNVGIPDDADESTPRTITRVAEVGYDRLFKQVSPGEFVHAYGGLLPVEGLEGTDVEAGNLGVVSITPIRGAGDDGTRADAFKALATAQSSG